ncbi:MAG: hypothetical protein H0X67_13805 [Acidobacteria bacterium]|nr:hypothetical protein [Acidobacteriota bacterium]
MLAMRALEAIDAPNDDPSRVARASEFVALAIVARRITQPGMTVADSRPDLPTAVVPPG